MPEVSIVPDNQIAGAAINAGFPPNEIVTAVAVALGESSGNRLAYNKNTNGSADYGLWQINNEAHKDIFAAGFDYGNQDENARAAFKVWQQAGGKWTPWAAYNNGRYRMFLGRADIAAKNPDTAGKTTTGDTQGSFQSVIEPLKEISDILAKIMNPKVWASVALIGLGGVILIIVAVKLVSMSPTTKKVAKSVVSAVPGGGAVSEAVSKVAK